jgi:hypothetical protein
MSQKPKQENQPATLPSTSKKNYEIVWENGVPRALVPQPKFDKTNAAHLLAELSVLNLNFPYEGDDPKYFGMTKGEAISAQFVDAAANGDKMAIKELMDRVMGKPQQNIKSVSVKGTLGEFLDTLDTSEADVIDI